MDNNTTNNAEVVNSPDPFIQQINGDDIDWGTFSKVVVPIERTRRKASWDGHNQPAAPNASNDKSGARRPKKAKTNDVSPELRFSHAMSADPHFRVGGPTGDTDGRVDATVYQWRVDDGAACWHIVDPKMLEAKALRWLNTNESKVGSDRAARSCAATLVSWMIGQGQEKWLPAVDVKRNFVPLRGQYLSISDEGVITCHAPDPSFGLTYCVNADFQSSKVVDGVYHPSPVDPASRFGGYLAQTFDDDDVRNLAQEAFATILINRCFEKSIWMYGDGENGKSVMIHILTAIVGGRAAPVKLDRLVRDHFGTAALHGARLATVAEVPKALTNGMQDLLKELISWDAQPLERKGRDAFTFRPFAVFVLASNVFPRVSQHEHGFWRKVLTVPLTNRVAAKDKIHDFHKLITENPAEMAQVIDWLLAGAQRLIRRGGKFGELPAAVVELAHRQRMESDQVAAFLVDQEVQINQTSWTSKLAIYQAYRDYCDERGKQPLGEPAFWVGVRSQFKDADLDGRKGPAAGPRKTRERYVPLQVEGVDPLPTHRTPESWLPLGHEMTEENPGW